MADRLPDRPAKKLSPEQASEKRKRAFELEVQVKQALAARDNVDWLIAEALYLFEEGDEDGPGWAWLGYESVSEFCAQPEVGLRKSKYYSYVKVWRELVVSGRVQLSERSEKDDGSDVPTLRVPELENVSLPKAAEVLPAITRGDTSVEDALEDAKTLGWRDLRQQYKQDSATPPGSALDASKEPERCQCPTCNTWVDLDQLNGAWEIDKNGDLREVIDGTGQEVSS